MLVMLAAQKVADAVWERRLQWCDGRARAASGAPLSLGHGC